MNEINEKYIRIHLFKYPEFLFAIILSHRDRKPKYASKFWTKHGGNGKRWPLIPFPFLAPWPSRPPAIETPPRPVPARPLISWPKNASCSRMSPRASSASLPPRRWAMTRHRLSLRPCTAPLSCILQPLLKLSPLSLGPSLLQFVSTVSPLLNHGNLIFEPVCVFLTFSSSAFVFLIAMNSSFKSLFAIWSLSPQRFHYYFFLRIVSWQYQKYSTILILVLCLLCITPLVCSSYSSFAPSSSSPWPFFSSWWQKDCELLVFTHIPVLQCSPSTSSRQPQTTHVFVDSRIALLCRALRICVAHAPTESCSFSLLVHWAFRACYRSHLPLLHHTSLPQNWPIQTSIPGQPLWAPLWCFCVAR